MINLIQVLDEKKKEIYVHTNLSLSNKNKIVLNQTKQ